MDLVVPLSPRGRLAGLFLLALVLRLAAWAVVGTRPAADTPAYVEACTSLVAHPSGLLTAPVGWEYLGFLVPFCATTLGGAVPEVWIVAQSALSALVCVLLVATGTALGNRGAGWLAGIAYAVLPEALQWDLYVLSDAWFVFLLMLSFWLLVRPEPAPRWVVPTILTVLAVSRPFGVPVVAALLVLHAATGMAPRIGLGRRSAVAAVVALPVVQWVLSSRQGWSSNLFPRLWQEGYVVDDDTTLLIPAGATADTAFGQVLADPFHFLLLAAAKAVLFFAPAWPRFSLLHNLIGLATLAPIVVLGIWGLVRGLRAREPAAWVAAAVFAAVTGIVAVTFIDYDWRYRLPLLPLLSLFAARAAWPAVAWLGTRVGLDLDGLAGSSPAAPDTPRPSPSPTQPPTVEGHGSELEAP